MMDNELNGQSKPVMVRKLGTGQSFRIQVAPETTAQMVLTQIGAAAPMILTTDPRRAVVLGEDEALWEVVEPEETLYAALPTPVGL
jgi:hypothetical protein